MHRPQHETGYLTEPSDDEFQPREDYTHDFNDAHSDRHTFEEQKYPFNDISGYADEPYGTVDGNGISKALIDDPTSPFFGMDPELVGFVQKHNVVMDDGAVVNKIAMLKKAAMDNKVKRKFVPPFGLSLRNFILLVVGLFLLTLIIVVAVAVGLTIALRINRPNLPQAQPWWKRTQMYQINVATWANDIGGPTGRFQDVAPRMAYLSTEIKATSAILTNFLTSDVNGIIDWVRVSQSVDQDGMAFSTLIPQLLQNAKQPLGSMTKANPIKLLIGLPIYATSIMHSWFQSSQTSATNAFSSFYMWTDVEPKTPQERRYFAYDIVRRAYYRHVHGNPNSPLLNLTNPDVQQEMIKVVEFWKQKMQIQGLMIMNSTNILPEFISGIRKIMTTVSNNEFIWFADEPQADQLINPGDKVCYVELSINIRVPTRTIDLTGQIATAMKDTRFTSCTPIWKVNQFSDDNKDFGTVQKLAYFLPGNFLMIAGQEVDLTTGTTELIKWSFKNYLDYTTYWPQNLMLIENGLNRLQDWKTYANKALTVSLLATDISSNRFRFVNPPGSDNLFVAYREYIPTLDRAYFIVSFQTLNTIVYFRTIFFDLNLPKMEVAYDSKNVYKGRRQFGAETLVNNEVLILYYY